MILNDELFPPEVDYEIPDSWDKLQYNTRQVRIMVDGETLVVVNSTKHSGEWSDPHFVILRAHIPVRELNLLSDILDISKSIMQIISKDDTTKADIEKLFPNS